jgi:thioredoxin-like negative regulator of GroEL
MRSSKELGAAVCLAVISLSFATASASPSAATADIRWLADANAGFKRSSVSKKPILFALDAVWCEPCRLMERTTYQDPEVQRLAAAFVPIKVDLDSNQDLARRHGVEILPTVLVLDWEGNELTRHEGYVPAEVLSESMREASHGYAEYLAHRSKPDDAAALQAVGEYLFHLGNDDEAWRALKAAEKIAPAESGALRESIELDLAIVDLSRGDLESAAQAFERIANTGSSKVKERALIGLLISSRRLKHQEQEESAISRLGMVMLGIEGSDGLPSP